MNNCSLLLRLLDALHTAQIPVRVFGGWAEELLGLIAPRAHGDIDLLLPGMDFDTLDMWLSRTELPEIAAKCFSHKRAFLFDGVMVEVLLVRQFGPVLQTDFFSGGYLLTWPAGTLTASTVVDGNEIPAASPAALAHYRSVHAHIEHAYRAAHNFPNPQSE